MMTMRSVDGRTGLTKHEAHERLVAFGSNEIERERTKSGWSLLFEQFKSPLVLLLVFACILSAALGEWIESAAISAILILNAVIGFIQEYRAESAISALRDMTAPRAKVIRDGRQTVISAKEVVPGDVLVLESGDVVAADGKIVESSHLQINEAILTGESLPVEKAAAGPGKAAALSDRVGDVFMGTTVVFGTALVEVTATAMKTQLGQIAHLIETAESALTPLQNQMKQIGSMLLIFCFITVSFVALLSFFQEKTWLEIVIYSISLMVAAVPEGMPAIVTIALALGVQRMAARNALVRKLPSVETLGSVSVICTDKTGTLTTGKMRVRELWGENHIELLRSAVCCCDAELDREGFGGTGDPTEIAILLAARERGIEKDQIEHEFPRIETIPFDSDRKRMSIFRADNNLYVKGAFESLLPLCTGSKETLSAANREHQELTGRGLRVLAVATGKTQREAELELVGLIGMADPPRTEVVQAITEARGAGILPVMITGDHPTTALAIARELRLVTENDDVSGRVHARATPEDKLMLVRKWKSKGAIVAMTGDGVNDAPALREAHIGIAMGKTGTEVTRQSADLVLADDNFATIIAAVREGRAVYQNIRKVIIYLLAGNTAELAVVLGASILGLPLPFLAVHLLWINLVTDSLPGLALIADPVSPDIMKRPPRKSTELLLGRREWASIVAVGLLEASVVLGVFKFNLEESGLAEARNIAFTTLVMSQLLRSFGARSRRRIFWQVGVLSNLWLLGVVLVTALLQISLHYLPLTQDIFAVQALTQSEIIIIGILAIVPISLIELTKLFKNSEARA